MIHPNPERGVAVMSEVTRAFNAISAELGDYSQRLLADGTATFSQLASAQTVPEYMGVISAFTKRAMEEGVQQMLRMGSMYASAASDQTRALQALLLPDPHR
jgi:hypothetical protein